MTEEFIVSVNKPHSSIHLSHPFIHLSISSIHPSISSIHPSISSIHPSILVYSSIYPRLFIHLFSFIHPSTYYHPSHSNSSVHLSHPSLLTILHHLPHHVKSNSTFYLKLFNKLIHRFLNNCYNSIFIVILNKILHMFDF